MSLIWIGVALIGIWPAISPLFVNLIEVPHIEAIYSISTLLGLGLVLIGSHRK